MSDKIETLDDWNERLTQCGCCPMPAAPVPELVADTIGIGVELCGGSPSSHESNFQPTPCQVYQTRFKKLTVTTSQSRSDQGSLRTQTVTKFFRGPGNVCTWTQEEVDGWDGGEVDPGDLGIEFNPPAYSQGGGTGSYFFFSQVTGVAGPSSSNPGATWDSSTRVEWSEGSSDPFSELKKDADALIAKAYADREFWCYFLTRGGACFAETTVLNETDCLEISPPKPLYLRRSRSKYYWKIPSTHLGTKFKITWNVLFRPAVGIPVLEADMTWNWSGPGKQEEPDGDSWKSPEYELAPSDVPGTREIVNIRFETIPSNPYGTKPQITGTGYDPANP